MLTALAHVIVTEGLVDEAFVRERCDSDEFQRLGRLRRRAAATRPRPMAAVTGVAAGELRAAARLYATGGNAAIYYGLGVTEHSQGSTTVMAIANLAMATGNIGRARRRREPAARPEQRPGRLRHGLVPARAVRLPPHLRRRDPRDVRGGLGRARSTAEPGLRIPNMLDAAVDGTFKAIYIQGEDILQSDPNTKHVAAGLAAMECVVVQDLFLNETANYAHVFLPGSTFLEKDGTFTNAERRIQRVRKVMAPQQRLRGLGGHPADSPTRSASTGATPTRPRSWTRSPA